MLASMQAHKFADECGLDPDSPDVKSALQVVIAYEDIQAGKHAMHVLTTLARGSGDEIELKPLPWSFDLLADADGRKAATSDAAKSDILMIATSGPNPLPPSIGQWAESAIEQKRGTATAVVALFGPAENPDSAGSSRLEAIHAAARRAGLAFFAPTPRHEIDEAIERIRQRAEMVTPVLEKILHLE